MRGATWQKSNPGIGVIKFQSTLLMRGATSRAQRAGRSDDRISIHAPHARSDSDVSLIKKFIPISIHAPHARSDGLPSTTVRMYRDFNPRSSCEERRDNFYSFRTDGTISIHAPHARSDTRLKDFARMYKDFNPRSSCEERLLVIARSIPLIYISIHAPHARSD